MRGEEDSWQQWLNASYQRNRTDSECKVRKWYTSFNNNATQEGLVVVTWAVIASHLPYMERVAQRGQRRCHPIRLTPSAHRLALDEFGMIALPHLQIWAVEDPVSAHRRFPPSLWPADGEKEQSLKELVPALSSCMVFRRRICAEARVPYICMYSIPCIFLLLPVPFKYLLS